MKFRNIEGKEVNTDTKEVICPYCKKVITKEEINDGQVFLNVLKNPRTGEQFHELWHLKCADPHEGKIVELSKWKSDNK
jgi:hypothetical protein